MKDGEASHVSCADEAVQLYTRAVLVNRLSLARVVMTNLLESSDVLLSFYGAELPAALASTPKAPEACLGQKELLMLEINYLRVS
jgi:hypothetical protein